MLHRWPELPEHRSGSSEKHYELEREHIPSSREFLLQRHSHERKRYQLSFSHTVVGFFYLNKTNNQTNCMEGYTQCGWLNDYSFPWCLALGSICPINDIVINNQSKYKSEDITYTTVQWTEGEYLHFTNKAITKKIIIDFKISDSVPCIRPSERNIDNNYNYTLIKNNYLSNQCSTEYKGKSISSQYSWVDTMNKNELYKNNNINLDYMNNPDIITSNEKVSWYQRSYINLNISCMVYNNYSMMYLNTLPKSHWLFQRKYFNFARCGCSTLSIVIIIMLLILFFKQDIYKKKNVWYPKTARNKQKKGYCFYIVMYFTIVQASVLICLSIMAFDKEPIRLPFECIDEDAFSYYDSVMKQYVEFKKIYNFVYFLINVLVIVLMLFNGLIWWIIHKSQFLGIFFDDRKSFGKLRTKKIGNEIKNWRDNEGLEPIVEKKQEDSVTTSMNNSKEGNKKWHK